LGVQTVQCVLGACLSVRGELALGEQFLCELVQLCGQSSDVGLGAGEARHVLLVRPLRRVLVLEELLGVCLLAEFGGLLEIQHLFLGVGKQSLCKHTRTHTTSQSQYIRHRYVILELTS
jgi:hypothetical protein